MQPQPPNTAGKKFSRRELEDIENVAKYKEAFDTFDWNKTSTIATSVRLAKPNYFPLYWPAEPGVGAAAGGLQPHRARDDGLDQ